MNPIGPEAGAVQDPYYRRVPIRIVAGQRVFAPSWLMTGLTLGLLVLFMSLGRWQWGRAEMKSELWAKFERGSGESVALGQRPTTGLPRYARVRVEGRWQPQRQFLLDNRTRDGHAGYEVLTPFVPSEGGRVLLVNRGWVPFSGYRDRLPDVGSAFTEAEREDPVSEVIVGRIDELPSAGLAVGRAAPALSGSWPRVTAYPRPEELSAALQARVEPRVLLLDPQAPRGYLRDWKPGGRGPEQNWSYAIQWWSFAVLLLGLYVGLNLRRAGGESK